MWYTWDGEELLPAEGLYSKIMPFSLSLCSFCKINLMNRWHIERSDDNSENDGSSDEHNEVGDDD